MLTTNTERGLRDSEERFRVAAETASDVIFDCDVETGEIEIFGDPGDRLGYPESELPRSVEGWAEIVHFEDRDRVLAAWNRILAGGIFHEEYRVACKDGRVRYWSDHACMLRGSASTRPRVIRAVTDVTQRVRHEERITAMNATLRELSAKLLLTQDEERRWLSRELHDSTAQTLTALSLQLSLLGAMSGIRGVPEAIKAIDECVSRLQDCICDVRTFCNVLHPPLLDDLGLESAVRDYLPGFEKNAGIAVELTASKQRSRRQPVVDATAYRFIQETLSNIERHAHASRAHVRIVECGDCLGVEVEDDGCGFPANFEEPDAAAVSGLGIAGLRERARHIGGDFHIHSTAGGSTVTISIPFK